MKRSAVDNLVEQELKRRRTESLLKKYSGEQVKQIQDFVRLLFPQPTFRPKDFNMSEKTYETNKRVLTLRYEEWLTWFMDVWFVVGKKLPLPYLGTDEHQLPPSDLRERKTNYYTSFPCVLGTGILIYWFRSSLFGPRAYSQKKPILPKDDQKWSRSYLSTDFYNWIRDKRFFFDLECILHSPFVASLSGPRLNEYDLVLADPVHTPFTGLTVGIQDEDHTSPILEYAGKTTQPRELVVISHPPLVNPTWGVTGSQKLNYPSNWPPPSTVNEIENGIYVDWPKPLQMVDHSHSPSLLASSLIEYPSSFIRSLMQKVLDKENSCFMDIQSYEAAFEWMMSGSKENPFFQYCGLINTPSLSPPVEWRRVIIYNAFVEYARAEKQGWPFTLYLTTLCMEDDSSSLVSLTEKVRRQNDVTPFIVLKNSQWIKTTVSLLEILAWSPSMRNYLSVIQSGTYYDLDSHYIRILSEFAFRPFRVNTDQSSLILSWNYIEFLQQVGVTPTSSSHELRFIRHFFTNEVLKQVGSAVPKEHPLKEPSEPSDSKFSTWNMTQELSSKSNLPKIRELFNIWKKDDGNWFKQTFINSTFESRLMLWETTGETDPIYEFIQQHMIPPLKERGLFSSGKEFLKSAFNPHGTDYERLVDLQFRSYIHWCQKNVEVMNLKEYPVVGEPLLDKEGKKLYNSRHQQILNVIPDLGILQSEGSKTPTMLKFMGAWWLLFKDDFYGFLKSLFNETFELMMNALEWLKDRAKEIVSSNWGLILGVGAGIIGAIVLTKKLETMIE